MRKHLDNLQKLVDSLPGHKEEALTLYSRRLRKNLESIELKYDPEDPRIMQEIGIFLDRCDITEEIERFNTHLIQVGEIIRKDEPVGRKLDFLMQELNREANTICSKSNHTAITQIGVDMKCEIEKLREQVQNIE
jgi:uncharacterized protein (TIGR00255 family)